MSGDNPRSRHGRRRTRSVGSVPMVWRCSVVPHNCNVSDEKYSSSTSKDVDFSNFCMSNSDDMYDKVNCKRDDSCHNSSTISPEYRGTSDKIESDSFNENSPHRQSARKKRKFKRIAVDVEMSTSRSRLPYVAHYQKKKRIIRIPSDGGRFYINTGKRKRSLREKLQPLANNGGSSDAGECLNFNKESKVLGISKLSLNDYPEQCSSSAAAAAMEVSYTISGISSSSISSSGSETGIFTNDEGREGDDEQSDWICSGDTGLGPTADIDGKNRGCDRDHEQNERRRRRHQDAYVAYETFFKQVRPSCAAEEAPSASSFKLLPPPKTKDEQDNSSLACVGRKKGRPTKCAFDFSNPLSEKYTDQQQHPQFCRLLDSNFKRKNEIDVVESGTAATRRHTFSSYKRRKRFAQPTQLFSFIDSACESTCHFPVIPPQPLTDISSSDSKDSMQ